METETFKDAKKEFNALWERTLPLSKDLIEEYRTRLYYSIERWDMDYNIANSQYKPNYMQRRALKELNRIRAMGATKALTIAAAGSGKTFLAAFDGKGVPCDVILVICMFVNSTEAALFARF